MDELNELRIQQAVMVSKQNAFVLPNYTPRGWWECDVFELTKSGFFCEYEIKCTRGDFRADAFKSRRIWSTRETGFDAPATLEKKHEVIGDPSGPSRFYYVTPKDLIAPNDVPKWAGLILARSIDHHRFLLLTTVKRAPKLHNVRLADEVVKHSAGVCYWRFRKLFFKQ